MHVSLIPLCSRQPGSYIDIPAISTLENTDEITVAVCLRGAFVNGRMETRGNLIEWFNPPPALSATHLWMVSNGVVMAQPTSVTNTGSPVYADVGSHTGWFQVAFTVSEQGISATTELFVNGVEQGSETGSGTTLQLMSNIRLGNNPDGLYPDR